MTKILVNHIGKVEEIEEELAHRLVRENPDYKYADKIGIIENEIKEKGFLDVQVLKPQKAKKEA